MYSHNKESNMTDKKPNKQVHLLPNINKMLEEIAFNRKMDNKLNSTKQSIVAELIIKQHKKEIK